MLGDSKLLFDFLKDLGLRLRIRGSLGAWSLEVGHRSLWLGSRLVQSGFSMGD
jgi:hypothetical protein